jgi:phosphatidate phosphatase APP1
MLRGSVKYLAKAVAHPIKKIRLGLKQSLGIMGKPVIIPFRGYGNSREIVVMGYVIENSGVSRPIQKSSVFQNIFAMSRRYLSDAIPGVRVAIKVFEKETISITDQNGFFQVFIKLDNPPLDPMDKWYKAEIELLDQILHQQSYPVTATAEILILKESDSNYGIISDVDDTILISHSFNFLKKIRLMLFKNAYTRLPFEGVAAFYRALFMGHDEKCHNPIFFVSSSEANLYDLLIDFSEYRNIPKASFLLKEMKLSFFSKKRKRLKGLEKHAHKLEKIRHLFEMFTHLNFVLIGDSGQHDAEIYEQISKEFPDRILAVYIRDVRRSRLKKVKLIGQNLFAEGIDLLLCKDTSDAAKHACELGLISEVQYEKVCLEQKSDHVAEVEI